MGFGSDLKDQFPDLVQFTANGIQFLQDFRDFLKERTVIEQQYAQAMDRLAKNYIKKFRRSGQSFYGAGSPFQLASTEIEGLGTCAHGFLKLLTETENNAKHRSNLIEKLSSDVSGALKFEIKRKEDARQKHIAFSSQLSKNYDAQKAETDATKNAYRSASRDLDSAYVRYDKAGDKAASERAYKDWNEALIEKTDRRNDYILAVASLNAWKQRHYHTDMPILMDHVQDLNEHIIQRGKEIMLDYVQFDNVCLQEMQASNTQIIDSLNLVNASQDSNLFIQHIRKPWIDPPSFSFEPYTDKEEEIIATQPSDVHLLNNLQRLTNELETCQKDIIKQNKEIDGLKNLRDAYQKDNKLGDPVEVWQNVIEAERVLLQKESLKTKIQVQLDALRGALGDIQLIQHQLKSISSGTCNVCSTSLSLFSKGSACSVCNVKFHVKCQVKVPPLCGTEFTLPGLIQPVPSGTTISRKPTTSRSMQNISSVVSPGLGTASVMIKNQVRVLFDFQGTTEEDLTVREGDILTVVTDDNGTGWMTCEIRGVVGAVPANYVEKIEPSLSPSPQPQRSHLSVAVPASPKLPKVRALYSYAAQSDIELSLKEGEVIEVTNKDVGDGWWEGKLHGKTGQFPANYVEDI